MKLIVLFVGLISLIFFNNRGCHTSSCYSLPNSHISYWVEDDSSNDIQGIEESETAFVNFFNDRTSKPKRQNSDSNVNFLSSSNKIFHSINILKTTLFSNINLFIIYHFSLSLWQIFLQ